jgi:outer membrane lipoprotein SlyB
MKLVSAMVVVLTVAGCASSAQQSSPQYAQAQTDEQKCRTGTLKPGTAEYDKCRAIFDAQRKQPSSY